MKTGNEKLKTEKQIEVPYELPEGWKWGTLGNECEMYQPKTISTKDLVENGKYTVYGANGIIGKYNDYNHEESQLLVTCRGATCGAVNISEPFSWINGNAMVIKSKKNDLLRMYLYYLFMGQIDFNKIITGSAQPQITRQSLVEVLFPLPPLSEQQRIVNRIEYMFAKLDEAKEKAQIVVDSFETRKAAILHQAFTGKLTAKWRKENGVSDDSWKEKKLEDVLIEKPRNGYSITAVDYETPYKSMSLSATTSGYFRPEFYKYIDADISDDSFLWLKKGDILIQRANSLDKVGTSAIYTGSEHEFIYPDLMMKLQVKVPTLYTFIAYQLKTEKTMAYFRNNATGTAGNMPKINQKTVCNLQIFVPTLPEQQEIVRILDNVLEKERTAKESAENVLEQIDLLKKSVLARAFRGEL